MIVLTSPIFSRRTHFRRLIPNAYVLVSLLFSLPMRIAHDGEHKHTVRQVKPTELNAPTPIPDRIVLTWADDPRYSQAVTWRTSTEVLHGIAEIAPASHGTELQKLAVRVEAKTEHLKTDINEAHFHSVRFKELRPNTRYAYRVGDGTNWSEWLQFSTASDQPEPFSFIYFGDAQNEIRSMWSRVIREAQRDAPKSKFMVHVGDLINKAESDAEWGEWFGAGEWLNGMMPSVPVPGNHEHVKLEGEQRRLSHHWRRQFTLPEQGPSGLEETCFAIPYQNTLIVGLNSNEQFVEQAKWLDEVLSENKLPWVICAFHHPVFSTANDRDNAPLRAAWKPILDKHRVDLVLQGHDHSYGRTTLETPRAELETIANLPTGERQIDMFTGTVYVVSVSGPKMYRLDPKPFMARVAEDTQLYQIIHVNGDKLRFESRTAIGQLYDAFVLEKQPSGINKLMELEPEISERRRSPQSEEPQSAELSTVSEASNVATPASTAKQ